MPAPWGIFGKSARTERGETFKNGFFDRQVGNITRYDPVPEERAVFLIKWGSTGSSSFSFHYALLVSDTNNSGLPNASTEGFTFSWGSIENGEFRKRGSTVNPKRFNYQKELEMNNSYEFVGRTKKKNEEIVGIMNEFGNHYNIVLNNCQIVTCKVAENVTGSFGKPRVQPASPQYQRHDLEMQKWKSELFSSGGLNLR